MEIVIVIKQTVNSFYSLKCLHFSKEGKLHYIK